MAKRSLALATFCIILAITVAALPQGNSIRGKVSNSAGRNLSQVVVQLETGNGQPINVTVTNNEGDFSFAGLTETSYIIVIREADYNPITEHVDFVRTVGADDPGERRTVQITLVPKGGLAPTLSNRTVTGQSVPRAAREALERGLKLSKESKMQEAVAAFQEAVTAYTDYFDAHLLLAGEYLKMDRLDESIAEFEQARKINSKDDRVFQGFGQVLMRQKKYALASQVFGEASRLNPTDPTILLMRATALLEHALSANASASKEATAERERSFALAEGDLVKAFELSGRKLASVHLQLARLYEKKGDRSRAADELERYLKMVPDDKRADSIKAAIKTLRMPTAK